MKIDRLLLLSFLVFSTINIDAQDYVDLAKFHYASTPLNQFDSIGGDSDIREYGLDVTLPIKLNESNVILSGFSLEQINTKIHPFDNYRRLSSATLKLGFNKKHSKKWSGTYMLLPKLSSDFKNIGGKEFQLGGLVLMKYSKKENLKYSIGSYYNNELFGPFAVPLFGLYYKSENDKFEANITLPLWVDINYSLNNWLTAGGNFSATVRSYNLSENNAYVVKKSNEIFGYLQFHLTKSILLQTKAGYSIGRSYQAYDGDDKVDFGFSAFRFGDDRTSLNPVFSDGLIYRARLIYRFHIEK